MLGEWLANRLGQPFIVETRLGGGGTIGTEVVVRSAPDGYTLLLLSGGLAINAAFYPNLSYDLVRDIAPVAAFFKSAHIMLLSPSVPAETVPEFVAYAKANPGKINFGSNGVGATGHLAGEMFKVLTGVDMLHVPYRGEAPALTDLLSGRGRQALEIEFLKGALKPWRAADERMAAVHQPRATNAASSPEIEGYYLAGRGPR